MLCQCSFVFSCCTLSSTVSLVGLCALDHSSNAFAYKRTRYNTDFYMVAEHVVVADCVMDAAEGISVSKTVYDTGNNEEHLNEGDG